MEPEDTGHPHPGGRPSLYRTEYTEQARKLCRLGATDIYLADFLAYQFGLFTDGRPKMKSFGRLEKLVRTLRTIRLSILYGSELWGIITIARRFFSMKGRLSGRPL